MREMHAHGHCVHACSLSSTPPHIDTSMHSHAHAHTSRCEASYALDVCLYKYAYEFAGKSAKYLLAITRDIAT